MTGGRARRPSRLGRPDRARGGGAVVGLPSAAHAAGPVLPGNEGDVGVYTDGQSHVMEIGDPAYTNVAEVADQLKPGVPFTASSMHQSIFDKDLAAGGTDYYLDRVLGVPGTLGSAVLMTRGRSLYMRGASNNNFTVMGFAGSALRRRPQQPRQPLHRDRARADGHRGERRTGSTRRATPRAATRSAAPGSPPT